MNGRRLLVMGILIAVVVLVVAYTILSQPSGECGGSFNYSSFTVGGKTYRLTYLATTQSECQNGLMNTKITNDTTELFVFRSSGYPSFWMHGVNSSLDIIWLSASGNSATVVYLQTDLPGCSAPVGCPSYTPTSQANLVLEAKAGFASSNSIAVGTVITFS